MRTKVGGGGRGDGTGTTAGQRVELRRREERGCERGSGVGGQRGQKGTEREGNRGVDVAERTLAVERGDPGRHRGEAELGKIRYETWKG